MATVAGYALRLPASIMKEVKKASEMEGTSINQFITVAVARRLAELKTVRYFEERAAKANPDDLQRILATAGTLPPREGDEIPEGWLEETVPDSKAPDSKAPDSKVPESKNVSTPKS